jgi:hypothetical protein
MRSPIRMTIAAVTGTHWQLSLRPNPLSPQSTIPSQPVKTSRKIKPTLMSAVGGR